MIAAAWRSSVLATGSSHFSSEMLRHDMKIATTHLATQSRNTYNGQLKALSALSLIWQWKLPPWLTKKKEPHIKYGDVSDERKQSKKDTAKPKQESKPQGPDPEEPKSP